MLLNYENTTVNGCLYRVGVFPIIKGKTKVAFIKPSTLASALIRIEDDEVLANTGFSEGEIESIRLWIDNNRLSLWKTAQNTPVPSQEQLRDFVRKTVEDLDRLDKTNPYIASMARKELIKAIDDEYESRLHDAYNSWIY